MDRPEPPSTKPPVAAGCLAAAAWALLLGIAGVFVIIFLDSGANTGKVTLEPAAAYRAGTVEFLRGRAVYLVRLPDGDFLALSNLDAANRATPGRQCRIAPIPVGDRDLAGLVTRYRAELSPPAQGTELLFREDCNGAVYDVAGMRLDTHGTNLDRHPVAIDDRGRAVVDLARRICTARTASEPFEPVDCP